MSKAFQKGAVSFAAVDYTSDKLDNVAKNFSFISDLKNDLEKDGRLSRCDLGVFSQLHENQLKNLTKKYIKALKENIQDRFDGNLPVITAFEIFNPIRVPERQEAGFKEYGIAEIKVMADYVYQNLEDKLKEDWVNTRVGKGFFEEKMANLQVYIANVCETCRRQHFIHENN